MKDRTPEMAMWMAAAAALAFIAYLFFAVLTGREHDERITGVEAWPGMSENR